MRKLILLTALLMLSAGLAHAQGNTELNALPTPASNQIFYRSSDHQRITPFSASGFGVTYNDAQSTYNTEDDYGIITFDGNLTTIGKHAFWSRTTLTAIVWPNTVTSIGLGAFEQCTNLSSVNLQEGITSIGNDAFKDCSNVTSVTFLGGVVLNVGSFNSIGTAESPANLKMPSSWLANDKPVNSTTPWHGGYFNCTYEKTATELLGSMGTKQNGPALIVTDKDDNEIILYSPKSVEYIKVKEE